MSTKFEEIGDLKDIVEFIELNKNRLTIKSYIITGKDGDFIVTIAPSLMISGYGSNEKEAKDSFKLSMDLFCESFIKMSSEQRDKHLISLGFVNQNDNKNYSKQSIDQKSSLKGFNLEKPKLSTMRASATC